MKHFLRILLVTAILWVVTTPTAAAVYPFVNTEWGAAPAQVMQVMGVPAFTQINFEAKQTEYLAYRQTVSAYNFVFYYIFKNDQLYQVRLELREDNLTLENIQEISGTINITLENALTNSAKNEFSETTVQASADGEPYAYSAWWYTPVTFAALLVDTGTADGKPLFEVMLLDAAHPANAGIVKQYRDITEGLKAQQAAASEAPQARETAPPQGFTAKAKGYAQVAITALQHNFWIIIAVVVILLALIILKRRRGAARHSGSAAHIRGSSYKGGTKITARAAGGRFVSGKSAKAVPQRGFTAGGGTTSASAGKISAKRTVETPKHVPAVVNTRAKQSSTRGASAAAGGGKGTKLSVRDYRKK